MADVTARSEAMADQPPSGGRYGFSRILSIPGITVVLSLLGIGVAGYLTYVHFDERALVCTVGGCHTVQESTYSTIGPVPIAMLGLGMFVLVGALALARIFRSTLISDENANLVVWTITLTALLYYAYLTYVEIFVLDAICQWCVASAVITVGIFVVESVALWRNWSVDDEAAIE